jgi:hypothetical protein
MFAKALRLKFTEEFFTSRSSMITFTGDKENVKL